MRPTDPSPAAAPDPARPSRSLKQAVVTALVLVFLMIGAYLLGRPGFFVLICAVLLIALFELLDGVVQHGSRANIPFGLAAGFAMLLVAYLRRPSLIGVVLVATMLGAFLIALRPGRGAGPASDVAWTTLGVTWVGGGGAAATGIMMLPGGLRLLIAFILIAAVDDIAAYFGGTTLGRHKLAPSISAAKSWEGVIAGALGALLAGGVAGMLLDELGIGHGLALGAIAALFVPAGDLAESMFKRELGIKDSGRLLPGHGGLLDRLDAIIFAAPPIYLYMSTVVF